MLVPRIGSLRCFKLMKSAVWGPRPALVRMFCYRSGQRVSLIISDPWMTISRKSAWQPSLFHHPLALFLSQSCLCLLNLLFISITTLLCTCVFQLFFCVISYLCKSDPNFFFFFLVSLPSIFSFFLFVLFSFPFDSIEALLSGLCHNELSKILDIPEIKHIFFQI